MTAKRIAVVGAGAFGSWIALLAARAGFDTVFIEQSSPAHEHSSSGGASRIIRRAYGPDEIYTLLAHRAREMWLALLAEENRASCFRQTGVLWLAAAGAESIEAAHEIFERRGLVHRFLNVDGIGEVNREMNVPAGTVALFEPDCGALLAEQAVWVVADAAIRSGARYIGGTVRPPRAIARMDFLELETGEPIEADLFVFACGSWMPKVFPDVLGLAIFPTRQEVFFFEAASPSMPIWSSMPVWVDQLDQRIPYGFPDLDGAGIKVAFHRTGPDFDPDTGSREIALEQIAEAAEYLQMRFPALGAPVFHHAQVCHYENTSSGDLLIDRHRTLENVWFAGGGSGHGFKHAPAVGEYLLDAIQKGYSPEPRFRLAGKGGRLAKSVV